MTFANFKTMVAAFLQRDATSFTVGTCDFLGNAVNMARKASERLHDFELCKVKADLVVSLSTGGALANAKLAGTATAVSVKKIIKGFVPTKVTDVYVPVPTITRSKHLDILQRQADNYAIRTDLTQWPVYQSLVYLVRDADIVYLTPANVADYVSDPMTVRMDVVKWLPDYSAAGDTDFLLEHCTEYMLFKTVMFLQPFLKEDVRVPLIDALYKEAWRSVVAWDSQLVVAGNDITKLT